MWRNFSWLNAKDEKLLRIHVEAHSHRLNVLPLQMLKSTTETSKSIEAETIRVKRIDLFAENSLYTF